MEPLVALALSPVEMMIVGVVAVLLFGGRLPDVARSAGKSLAQFRKGFRDIEDQIRSAAMGDVSSLGHTSSTHRPQVSEEEHEEATAPKFEPPPADPCVGNGEVASPEGR